MNNPGFLFYKMRILQNLTAPGRYGGVPRAAGVASVAAEGQEVFCGPGRVAWPVRAANLVKLRPPPHPGGAVVSDHLYGAKAVSA